MTWKWQYPDEESTLFDPEIHGKEIVDQIARMIQRSIDKYGYNSHRRIKDVIEFTPLTAGQATRAVAAATVQAIQKWVQSPESGVPLEIFHLSEMEHIGDATILCIFGMLPNPNLRESDLGPFEFLRRAVRLGLSRFNPENDGLAMARHVGDELEAALKQYPSRKRFGIYIEYPQEGREDSQEQRDAWKASVQAYLCSAEAGLMQGGRIYKINVVSDSVFSGRVDYFVEVIFN